VEGSAVNSVVLFSLGFAMITGIIVVAIMTTIRFKNAI